VTLALLVIGIGVAILAFRKPLARWHRDQVLRAPRNWARSLADDGGWFEVLVAIEGATWIAFGVLLLAG
jgi:hypothetical protein